MGKKTQILDLEYENGMLRQSLTEAQQTVAYLDKQVQFLTKQREAYKAELQEEKEECAFESDQNVHSTRIMQELERQLKYAHGVINSLKEAAKREGQDRKKAEQRLEAATEIVKEQFAQSQRRGVMVDALIAGEKKMREWIKVQDKRIQHLHDEKMAQARIIERLRGKVPKHAGVIVGSFTANGFMSTEERAAWREKQVEKARSNAQAWARNVRLEDGAQSTVITGCSTLAGCGSSLCLTTCAARNE